MLADWMMRREKHAKTETLGHNSTPCFTNCGALALQLRSTTTCTESKYSVEARDSAVLDVANDARGEAQFLPRRFHTPAHHVLLHEAGRSRVPANFGVRNVRNVGDHPSEYG